MKFKHARPTNRKPSPKIELKYTRQKKVSCAAVTKVIRYRSETERFNEILLPLTIPSTISNVESFPHTCIFSFRREIIPRKKQTFPSSISRFFRLYKVCGTIYRSSVDQSRIEMDQTIVITNSVINWKFGRKYIFRDTSSTIHTRHSTNCSRGTWIWLDYFV